MKPTVLSNHWICIEGMSLLALHFPMGYNEIVFMMQES